MGAQGIQEKGEKVMQISKERKKGRGKERLRQRASRENSVQAKQK